MRWTQDQVDRLVEDILPEKFKRKKEDPAWIALTHVQLRPKLDIDKAVFNDGGIPTDSILATCTNWGKLRRRAKRPDWGESIKSHFISVRDDFSGPSMQLAFVISHELGHIVWNNNPKYKKNWGADKTEMFCDLYAFYNLRRLHGKVIAEKILELYGSAHGWQQYRQEEKDA